MNTLSEKFVCGVHDITNEPYAGSSDAHDVHGLAVNTTNGAGPHNIQMFFLGRRHGTPLFAWLLEPRRLGEETKLAEQLNEVWLNPKLTRAQKDALFVSMQLGHIKQHSADEAKRSHLQWFDASVEANNPHSDFIKVEAVPGGSTFTELKTTDVVIHERMANISMPFDRFDVAAYSNYGKERYDKNENRLDPERVAQGEINAPGAAERAVERLDQLFNHDSQEFRVQIPDTVASQAIQAAQSTKSVVKVPSPPGIVAGSGTYQGRGVQVYNWGKTAQASVTPPTYPRTAVVASTVRGALAPPTALRATALTFGTLQPLASSNSAAVPLQALHATAQKLIP